MSLATRCTSCGTVFRVVQDQLKVSEGWVRCGRCSEVFNALQGLFDLERDVPPEQVAVTTAAGAHETAAFGPSTSGVDVNVEVNVDFDVDHLSNAALAEPFAAETHAQPGLVDLDLASPRESHHSHDHRTPADRVNERDRLDFPDAQFDPHLFVDETKQAEEAFDDPRGTELAAETEPAPSSSFESTTADIELPPPEATEPHFVIHAQRRARWQSPRMRAVLGSVLAALLVLLGLQGAVHFRDQLAASWPSTAPLLTAWCAIAACKIEAPRRIDDIVVESTALTRASLPDSFRLSVVLRNRSSVPLMLPSVDLSLTDATGQQVARRMLSPRDFRVAEAPVKPGAESPLQLVLLTTGATHVTGYTVEVFYP